MANCIRCCVGMGYIFDAYKLITGNVCAQFGGVEGLEITEGPLKDFTEQTRIALQISNLVRLVDLPYLKYSYATHFGNTLFPGAPSIGIPSKQFNLSDKTIEYLIVEQACHLKTNQSFLSQLAGMVTGIAATFFLFSTFPIASFILGILAGQIAKIATSRLLENKAMELVKKHASPEQMAAGAERYRRINISGGRSFQNERLVATLEEAINRSAEEAAV